MDQASIDKRLQELEELEQKYKTQKEMLQGSLAADEELTTLDDKLKEARSRFTAQKEALQNEPENRKLIEDMKALAQEIKDQKLLLGDALLGYFMKNNSLEYTDSTGQKRRFMVSAKLVRGRGEEPAEAFSKKE